MDGTSQKWISTWPINLWKNAVHICCRINPNYNRNKYHYILTRIAKTNRTTKTTVKALVKCGSNQNFHTVLCTSLKNLAVSVRYAEADLTGLWDPPLIETDRGDNIYTKEVDKCHKSEFACFPHPRDLVV